MSEFLPIVNESGQIIGKALRSEVHGNPSLLHPVVHLHIFNKEGQILFQRRSANKDLFPSFWDTAVGGHVAWLEDTEQALRREAKEELGISINDFCFCYNYIMRNAYESEYVQTFMIYYSGPFSLNSEEVAKIEFFKPNTINKLIGKKFFTPNAEEEIKLLKKALLLKE